MAQAYLYPTSVELTEIDQTKLPASMEGNPIFEMFPARTRDTHILEWEQKDNYRGLMKVRGMGGEPGKVAPVGLKRYLMAPGVYGEFGEVNEMEITARRKMGTVNEPVEITDLTLERSEQLLDRQNSRMTKIGWDLLCLGIFSSSNDLGAIVHSDSYTQRVYTPLILWSSQTTATPLQDFRNIKLLARGYSMTLGAGATYFMNQTTFNAFIANANPNDLAGRRTSGLGSVLSLELANALLAGEDLGKIVIVEDGAIDDSNNFQLYIPVGKIVCVAKRARGATIGEWTWTRNATNPGAAPGPYVYVDEQMKPPKKIEVHRGFNGGTSLFFPSAIIVLQVL